VETLQDSVKSSGGDPVPVRVRPSVLNYWLFERIPMYISNERKDDLWGLFIGIIAGIGIMSVLFLVDYISQAPDRQCDAIEARCDEGKESACARFKTECLKEK